MILQWTILDEYLSRKLSKSFKLDKLEPFYLVLKKVSKGKAGLLHSDIVARCYLEQVGSSPSFGCPLSKSLRVSRVPYIC
jgi:hypothetical protein